MKQKIKKIKGIKPDVRYLNEMRDVIYDRKWLKKASNLELYYMYRGIKRKGDLRYDITVIPARMLGKEFVKTKGHYHPENHGELYIVLKGKGLYLMQKEVKGKIEDVFYVKAKKGDYVIVPPQYGHITINPSKREELKMGNWVSKEFKSDYKRIEKKKGGCYYYTESDWVKNKHYKKIPPITSKRPKKSMPKDLSFL
jgi:glucose-6-phosphate isomerase